MTKTARKTLRLLSVAALVIAATQADAKPVKKPAKVEVAAEEVTESMSAKLVVGGGDSSLVADKGSISKDSGPESATAATTDTAALATSGSTTGSLAADSSSGAVDPAFAAAGTVDPEKAAAEAAKAAQAKLPESQIPVFQAKKDPKQAGGGGFFRIFMTLGILAVACGSAAFGLNRWAKKSGAKNQKSTQIKVLTSHHLGPKKNLTIVQVAGETILLGVTDHNITMLKTLSLLDDEIPESLPQKFDHSMEDFIEDGDQEDEPIAMRGLSEIRDTVSSRLKNMRNL